MTAEVIEAGPLEQLRAQERTLVRAAGLEILVIATADDVFAVGYRCTHQPAALIRGVFDPETCTIACPIHLSRFRLRTGEVMEPPAETPIPVYPVEIIDGTVYVTPEPLRGEAP